MTDTNVPTLDRLNEHIVGVRRVVDWMREHPKLDELIAPSVIGTGRMHAYVNEWTGDDAAANFATAVRALMAGAPIGTVRKSEDDNYSRVIRDFGGITLELYTSRAVTCEQVVVGTETVVETAVRCVHCSQPIAQNSVDGWQHISADFGAYRECVEFDDDGHEVNRRPATPPSFTAQVVEREITRWECRPILAGIETTEGAV